MLEFRASFRIRRRPRQSGDNGLVETKNGWIIRKHIGYGYIDQAHAGKIDSFYRDHLNPYLNYHRPCAQPELSVSNASRWPDSHIDLSRRRGATSTPGWPILSALCAGRVGIVCGSKRPFSSTSPHRHPKPKMVARRYPTRLLSAPPSLTALRLA